MRQQHIDLKEKNFLRPLCEGKTLSLPDIHDIATQIITGAYHDIEATALLIALQMQPLSSHYLYEFVKAARLQQTGLFKRLPFKGPVGDCCGTGGDHAGTYNISTTVALVAASGGLAIAKHGNRRSSSQSGTADVLEALGY